MAITIRQVGPCFAGEVDGIDLAKPLSPEDAAAIHAGMDRYAVLVFHGRPVTPSSRWPSPSRWARSSRRSTPGCAKPTTTASPPSFADVSNLDKDERVFERDSRTRLFALGNRLWHSDSSFKPTPAKYSLLHAYSIPSRGGNTEFADMRAGYDALDEETQRDVRGPDLRALAALLAPDPGLHRLHRRRSASASPRCARCWCAPTR